MAPSEYTIHVSYFSLLGDFCFKHIPEHRAWGGSSGHMWVATLVFAGSLRLSEASCPANTKANIKETTTKKAKFLEIQWRIEISCFSNRDETELK